MVATSLVAGIASTLTLTGLATNTISTAEQLEGRTVAVMEDSPGEEFAHRFGAHTRIVRSLAEAYHLLEQQSVEAVVFDRPQLLYYVKERRTSGLSVSNAEYVRQNYGFALPLSSDIVHQVNVHLLRLQESGRARRTVTAWLGVTEPPE